MLVYFSNIQVFTPPSLAIDSPTNIQTSRFAFISQLHAKKKHPIKALTLYVGVYYDIDIPLAPKSFRRKGTYKKFLRLAYDPARKVLRIYPRRKGQNTLIITNPKTGKVVYEFRIAVTNTSLARSAREIRERLGEIEGINVTIMDGRVAVDGQVLLPTDMKRIFEVVDKFGKRAFSLVTLSPLAKVKIARVIEREIANPEIQVRAVNDKFILKGVARDEAEHQRIIKIVKVYLPETVVREPEAKKKVLPVRVSPVIDLITVAPPKKSQPGKIIQLIAHFVELHKDYTKGFRFQWTPDLGDGSKINFTTGGNSAGGVLSTLTGTISNLLPKLNWAKEHGHARVLQSTSIIVEDREQGVVNSISRIPYQVVNAQGQPSTNFEEAGIRITITPSLIDSRSDSIRLNLNFSVKSLVSISDQGPLTSSREVSTVLVVRSGASAAVGGLISNESGTNYNKLPRNASRNPLISLYASKDFRRSQSQFVVFITPIIRASASAGSDKIKRKFRLKN